MSEGAISRGTFLLGGACLAMWAVARALAPAIKMPALGTVDTTTAHPRLKHGMAEVAAVISALRSMSTAWFLEQRPCDDGIWRLIVPMDDRHKGLVVLVETGRNTLAVKTAFRFGSSSNYARNVEDKCHGGNAVAA